MKARTQASTTAATTPTVRGRNKNVSADMQVFVDEFVTRMAELFRPGAPHARSLV